jgi:hypothetical protein
MNIEFSGHVSLDGIKKFAEFLGTMAAMQLAHHVVSLQLQRSKQGSGPMAFVVVCAALELSGP